MLFPLQLLYILVCWTQTSSPAETTAEKRMSAKKPELRLPLSAFWIPTLEVMSKAMARDFRGKFYEFATEYSGILLKHLSSETEVSIVNGKL